MSTYPPVTTLLRLLPWLALAAPLHALPPGVPAEPFSQIKEYGYMNWADGLNAPDLRIQTSELTPQETAYGIMESARVFFANMQR